MLLLSLHIILGYLVTQGIDWISHNTLFSFIAIVVLILTAAFGSLNQLAADGEEDDF